MGRKFNLFIIKLTSSQLVFWACKDKEKPPCLWGATSVDWAFESKSSGAVGPPYVASSLRVLLVVHRDRCTSYSLSS